MQLQKYFMQTFSKVLYPDKLSNDDKEKIISIVESNTDMPVRELIVLSKSVIREKRVFPKDLESFTRQCIAKARDQMKSKKRLQISKFIEFSPK